MALGVSEPIAESVDNSDGTSYSHLSGAFTPSANAILAVWVNASGTAVTTPTLSGGSLTWTLQQEETYNTVSKLFLFTAPTGASPASCTLVFDCTGDAATGCTMAVLQFTGTGLSIVQTADNAATGSTNPLVTFGANLNTANAYAAGWACSRNPAGSSGFGTETVDTGHTSPTSGTACAYKINGETGTTIQFTASSTNWAIAGIEIAEGGDKTISPGVLSSTAGVQGPAPHNSHSPGVLSAVASLISFVPNVAQLPVVFSSVSSVLAPSISAGNTQAPAVLTASASPPAPTSVVIQLPVALSAIGSVDSPAISAGNTQTPSVLSVVSSALDPVPIVSIFPGVISGIASAIAPIVTTGAADITLNPAALSSITSVPAQGLHIAALPSALVAIAELADPIPAVDVSPAVISALATAQSPSFVVVVVSDSLTLTAGLQAHTPLLILLPSSLEALAAVSQPTALTSVDVQPTTLSAQAGIQTPTPGVAALVALITSQAGIVAPVILANVYPIVTRANRSRSFSDSGRSRTFAQNASERIYSDTAKNRR